MNKNNYLNSTALTELSKELRKRIIETSFRAKIPHLGYCLSCLDILVYLYWKELKIDPKNPYENNRDRFVLSKGHGAPGLFQVLAERGFYSLEKLNDFGKAGSVFHEHPPKPGFIDGVEAATGSLGHGLPMALGMANAARINKLTYRTYALLSDGECNEGSIWEAAMLAGGQMIDSLTVIVDFNKWQATGRSKEIMALDPLKINGIFRRHVQEIDGHNFEQIQSLEISQEEKIKLSAIIANTIKGKEFLLWKMIIIALQNSK